MNNLAIKIIRLQQTRIQQLGFIAHIHFELEGCFEHNLSSSTLLYAQINQLFSQYNIAGNLVSEYWYNQWEFVSQFNGQSPLEEAHNLNFVITHLSRLAAKVGVTKTLIQPVVWGGDQGKLAQNCKNVFSDDKRAVHIPNAIQLNISASSLIGENIVANRDFGELLQQCFLQTSLPCCLLYLPEEAAFERFALKSKYGLARELCSPTDISGGHQGSIALYLKQGKHNQLMGEKMLLVDHNNQPLISEYHWQKTARIEHRLGASSQHYDPYANVVFALANLINALELFYSNTKNLDEVYGVDILPLHSSISLPKSLYNKGQKLGAIELFIQDSWLPKSINKVQQQMLANESSVEQLKRENSLHLAVYDQQLGDQFKQQILAKYNVLSLTH
ncbi:MAG: hypothetical protein COB35_02120 [Gammaproteobacteria bacterium]|nr:MAG: hypothetical protein COB35_02120 [Gammaproteobacteria bacterium]